MSLKKTLHPMLTLPQTQKVNHCEWQWCDDDN